MITRTPKARSPSPFADAYDALGRDGAEADVEKYLGAQAETLPCGDQSLKETLLAMPNVGTDNDFSRRRTEARARRPGSRST